MGRSLPNIVLGGFGAAPTGTADAAAGVEGRTVRSGDATDIGTLLAFSRKVMIVPGYGLAVAQAQHVAVELARALEARGVEVAYAIHPVAGRMPGHMNVLLAEADAPYEDSEGDGPGQRRVPEHRRGSGRGGQRRRQPGRPG